MARPIKKGLDYFPVDVDIFNDMSIRKLKRKHGAFGFLTFLTILCDIYRKEGYFLELSEDYIFDLNDRTSDKEDVNETQQIIDFCVDINLFDRNIYEDFYVLTSKSIQIRYMQAQKRVNNPIREEFDCIMAAETPVMESITPENDAISAQIKLDNNKLNETKENALTPFVCERVREKWPEWKKELLRDEDWRASVTRQAGEGTGFNARLPDLLNEFCDYLISSSEDDTVQTKKDFARRFHFWWQYHKAKKSSGRAAPPPERRSRMEEINQVGDESLEIARKILRCA